jgi:GNAT superfamily N-acetyltransferase
MVSLREFRPDDLGALYCISLATGQAGGDASHLYQDPKLMGHIYSAPYAVLAPESVVIASDDEGVAGYVLGAFDTEAWEDRLEREWWPNLRNLYTRPDDSDRQNWTPDQRRISMIFQPERTPAHVIKQYPVHLHMNLLPRLQRKGVGSRLFAAWQAIATEGGAQSMHVGVNRANCGAQQFWRSMGFSEITAEAPTERTIWMGHRCMSQINSMCP